MKQWLTGHELLERWNIERYDLASIVSDQEITAYDCEDLAPINVDVEALLKDNLRWWISDKGATMAALILGDINVYTDNFRKEFVQSLNKGIVDYLFKIEEIEAYEKKQCVNARKEGAPEDIPPSAAAAASISPAAETKAVNFFTREDGDYWHIGFEGREIRIKKLDGLLCIAYLLEKPGTSISCRKLYNAVSGRASGKDKVISEVTAIDEGLNIDCNIQPVSDDDARDDYWKRYQELGNDLDNTEDTLEGQLIRKEAEKEMNELMLHLKKRHFVDPNDKKAQANIAKRLHTAYEAISKTNMKELAKHLRKDIKTDGAYGYSCTGPFSWDITIK